MVTIRGPITTPELRVSFAGLRAGTTYLFGFEAMSRNNPSVCLGMGINNLFLQTDHQTYTSGELVVGNMHAPCPLLFGLKFWSLSLCTVCRYKELANSNQFSSASISFSCITLHNLKPTRMSRSSLTNNTMLTICELHDVDVKRQSISGLVV